MHAADNNQEHEGIEAPPRLVSALKGLRPAPGFIPPTVDEAILRAAREQLHKPVVWSNWFRFPLWAAGGAAALLLLTLILKLAQQPNAGSTFAHGDLNHDGRIDVLDAFALARQLKSGAAPSPQFDLNGDGVVDEHDVSILAAQAVKLQKAGAREDLAQIRLEEND